MDSDDGFEDQGDGLNYNGAFQAGLQFESRDTAVEWCRNIAVQLNFLLVIGTHKKRSQHLICDRGKKTKIRDMSTTIRKFTSRKACGCPFMLKLVPKDDNSYWVVETKEKHGYHNHRLIVYPEGHRQISGLNPSAKKVVADLSSSHVKPRHIMKAVNNSHPNLNPNMKHIYNCRHALRKGRCGERNAAQQFLHQAIEKNYLFWIKSDMTGRVTNTFTAYPTSVKIVCTWPQIIHIDATYKTNRYKYPLVEIVGMTPTNKNFAIAWALMEHEDAESYRWMLERLRNLIGVSVNPNVILTDRDLGLMKYMSDVFPYSAHLLCTWHINNDVEAWVASKCGGNRLLGTKFGRGAWRKVMNSSTVEEYNANVVTMMEIWGGVGQDDTMPFPQYITGTWLVHKEKFVACWTNQIRHFGSRTNNRVESSHNASKKWIDTPIEAIDTLFLQVDSFVEGQLIELRNSFEASMLKEGTNYDRPLLQMLNGICSQYCLQLIESEFGRILALDYDVNACGCVAETTHGFPCACSTFFKMQANYPLYVQDVDPFWYKLVIGDGVDTAEILSKAEQDRQYFQSLVAEVQSMDPAMMRHISGLINDELHPDRCPFQEPRVNTTSKGRGKMKRGMERQKSWFEHIMGFGSRSKSSGSSRGREKSSGSGKSIGSGGWRYDMENFPYFGKLPVGIHESIEGWNDVKADGNCGFRCVADIFFAGQDDWDIVRRSIVSELHQNGPVYHFLYGDDLSATIGRIRFKGTGVCGSEHWMEAIADLYPIANHYRCAIFFFCLNSGQDASATIFPLDVGAMNAQPQREMVIAHLGRYKHFILLQLRHGHLVPPITRAWFDRASPSVVYWGQYYWQRTQQYDSSTPGSTRARNEFINPS